MRNLKKVSTFVLTFILITTISTSICFAADTSYLERESNDTLNEVMDDLPFKMYQDINSAEIFGVVNNQDTVDYLKIEPEKTGVCELLLSIPINASAKISLYDCNGRLITSADKIIKDFVLRANNIYYVKVEYVSGGVWDRPYVVNWYMDYI